MDHNAYRDPVYLITDFSDGGAAIACLTIRPEPSVSLGVIAYGALVIIFSPSAKASNGISRGDEGYDGKRDNCFL